MFDKQRFTWKEAKAQNFKRKAPYDSNTLSAVRYCL